MRAKLADLPLIAFPYQHLRRKGIRLDINAAPAGEVFLTKVEGTGDVQERVRLLI
jgi:hypothetical protein